MVLCSTGKLCGSSRAEAVAHAADKTVEKFFYADGVGGRDKQNGFVLGIDSV
jgi:hypothetical protein